MFDGYSEQRLLELIISQADGIIFMILLVFGEVPKYLS